MRKMASIRRIDEIRPIPGADSIECAVVGGWNVVIRKGEFTVGDLAVYCEIDSWIPNELAPFLSKGQEPREYNGVRGERLRTIKLRGQTSQGLLLPIETAFPGSDRNFWFSQVNVDVSERLGIQKWEAPIPAELAGNVRGPFPNFIPKTDQERVQNLTEEYKEWVDNVDFEWEVTEKLDGSSMTVYFIDGDFGVCSRNWDLAESDTNTLWRVARQYNLPERLKNLGRNIAIQGELVGEGIQGNPYNLRGQDFYVFDVFNIDANEFLPAGARVQLVTQLGLKHVPVLEGLDFGSVISVGMDQLLANAEGYSVLNMLRDREGVVFKNINDPGLSFKAISNRFLLKEK